MLIDPWPYIPNTPVRGYDVLVDGLLVVLGAGGGAQLRRNMRVDEFHVILNYFDVLRERVGN